jgi:hypothetical protein
MGSTRHTNALFKDGKDIFKHNSGFLNLWISDDGSKYLAELRNIENGNFVDSLVLDGKEIYKGRELKEKIFSDNGQHYAYIKNPSKIGGVDGEFVVDGETKLQAPNFNFSQITNLGHYAVNDTNNKKFYIDTKAYNTDSFIIHVFINDNASNYLTEDGLGVWKLDGNIISLENTKGGVEIGDNIVYVYGLVK